jgi:hypothetical protein
MTELSCIINDVEMPEESMTFELVRQLFDYDPMTGCLTWKVGRSSNAMAGDKAGGLCSDGYIQVEICGQSYRVHRIIWLWMTGSWPEDEIDHKDLNRANNIWDNLRSATDIQNKYNRSKQKNNTSGFKGVWRHKDKWRACIGHAGKTIHLGCFDKPEDAAKAYAEAADRIAGSFARFE